jgi:hypothetical protein
MPSLRQLRLGGDPFQIGPIVQSPRLRDTHAWLFKPILEKLVEDNECFMLVTQHRFGPSILSLVNCFYQDKLKGILEIDGSVQGLKDVVQFVNHSHPHSFTGNSYANVEEIKLLLPALHHLLRMEVATSRIVVLCLYSGQKELVKRYLVGL